MLRIAQESLTNSSRHSNAKHFLADLYYDAAEIRLELRDDGGGFDVASRHDGFGLTRDAGEGRRNGWHIGDKEHVCWHNDLCSRSVYFVGGYKGDPYYTIELLKECPQ